MFKNSLYLFILVFVSCAKQDPEETISFISGYWEIEKVITVEGIEKQYNFNQTIDFFEVTDKKGIRKKLQPQLSGNFISTKDSEFFTISIENDSIWMYYKTPLSTWKEALILAKENQMIIQNESGNRYFYKSYTKIEL
ncbi:hypothetical protein [Aquimarina litoralis]|uniref:hypothetical protein n=1 Tax=Aquimarina litoralis TaxID=584605 RepID=UPI001C57C846|nr:hypothetical protein [Aquimarina litoralis]MBW1294526.1 hypothetical protein [Aquimarina litoralis]